MNKEKLKAEIIEVCTLLSKKETTLLGENLYYKVFNYDGVSYLGTYGSSYATIMMHNDSYIASVVKELVNDKLISSSYPHIINNYYFINILKNE